MPKRIKDTELIKDIQNIVEIYGPCSSKQYYKYSKYCEATIINHFGNFKNFTKLAKVPYVGKTIKISKEDILNDVLNIFNTYNNTTREFYLTHGKYSRAPIKRLFGSWNNLLKELKYPLNMRKSNDINKNEIINEMKSLYNQFGYLTAELQREKSSYSQSTIESVFGSFNNLLKELNLQPNSSGVRYSKKYILEEIQKLYNKYNFISCDLIEQECEFSVQTIYYKFDSLYQVCKILNIPYTNLDNMSKLAKRFENIISNILNSKPIIEKTFDWLRSDITNHLLRIDLFYEQYNLAIEIDGQQHYINNDFFSSSMPFEYRQHLDNLKEYLIKEHNIKFIRFTYKDNKKTIAKKISQIINS